MLIKHFQATCLIFVDSFRNIGIPTIQTEPINVPHPVVQTVPQPYPVAVIVPKPVPFEVTAELS